MTYIPHHHTHPPYIKIRKIKKFPTLRWCPRYGMVPGGRVPYCCLIEHFTMVPLWEKFGLVFLQELPNRYILITPFRVSVVDQSTTILVWYGTIPYGMVPPLCANARGYTIPEIQQAYRVKYRPIRDNTMRSRLSKKF